MVDFATGALKSPSPIKLCEIGNIIGTFEVWEVTKNEVLSEFKAKQRTLD
jgi:hypothetical protein